MNNGKNDLTEGSIGRKLISFFLPIAAGTLFQQLYNAADAIVVGKFVGTIALAAVGGSAAHITNLLIGFFVALSGGSTVVIAQLFDMESKLKLASKFDEIRSGLTEIIDCAGEIGDYNLNHSLSREVNDYTVKIKAIAMSLME